MEDLARAPRPHGIRWLPDDWAKLEAAAKILGDRENIEVTCTDIIRSGGIRRADEILRSHARALTKTKARRD